MDQQDWVLLKADIAAQQVVIHRVFNRLQERAAGLSLENAEKLESVAYQLHNFYGAVAGLLKVIATYFENHISDASRWHSLVLQHMTQPVEDVQPAVLSQSSYELLNALRGFRHFSAMPMASPWTMFNSPAISKKL